TRQLETDIRYSTLLESQEPGGNLLMYCNSLGSQAVRYLITRFPIRMIHSLQGPPAFADGETAFEAGPANTPTTPPPTTFLDLDSVFALDDTIPFDLVMPLRPHRTDTSVTGISGLRIPDGLLRPGPDGNDGVVYSPYKNPNASLILGVQGAENNARVTVVGSVAPIVSDPEDPWGTYSYASRQLNRQLVGWTFQRSGVVRFCPDSPPTHRQTAGKAQ
ncbi:hypothetical protein KIPB_015270, partial [Kipferlia bialata]